MKVQVNVQIPCSKEAASSLELIVAESDTVASLKHRLSALQLIPFPDQDLMLGGEVLADARQLSDCGIKDTGCSLDLVVKASEDTFVAQLKDLLQARDLSCEELGLLYCYKHGVNASQALQMLGFHGEKLQDFVKKHKSFQISNGQVALVRQAQTSLKLFSVAEEVEAILKASPTGSMEIKDICAKFAAKFNINFSSIAGARPVEFFLKEHQRFVISGQRLVSLRSAATAAAEKASPAESQGPDLATFVDVAPPPGLGGLACEPRVEVAAPSLESVGAPPGLTGEADDSQESAGSQQYLDLHNKIWSRSLISRATQALSDLVDAIRSATFLNVERVVKGGSIGKGTAISGVADAEVVFFLKGLPPAGHSKWLPPLVRAVGGVLADNLSEDKGVSAVKTCEDSVQISLKGLMNVDLRFSPAFESYAKTIQALGEQGPETRRFYAASLVEERVQFIARQPSSVKVTIRLLKWWRDQQAWSGALVRPTDEILELMAVYSAVQTKPTDQRAAIANVMSLLSRFDELRIVWSNYYTKADVWAPLLRQRPLLMDPVNPFVNIADPQAFDARELMEAARTTHFFW